MKAAVFYEPEDIRLEDVPGARGRARRGHRRGRGLRVLRLRHRVLLRAQPARHARRQGPARPRARVLRARSSRRASWRRVRARRGRPGRGQPDPELQRLRRPAASGKLAVLPNLHRARRDDERRLRRVREDEDRARVQAPRVADGRAGRVRRDALPRPCTPSSGPRSSPATSPSSTARARSASRWCSSLKNEGARVALVGTRDYRLELGKAARRRPRLEHGRRVVAVLHRRTSRRRSRSVNGGAARRPRARRHGVGRGEPAGDRDHRQRLDRRLHGPRRPGRRGLACRCSRTSTRTRRSGSRWLYPLQWPKTIRLLDDGEGRHGQDHHALGALDGDQRAIERVLNREDERRSRPSSP